jgi:hypothetical protein
VFRLCRLVGWDDISAQPRGWLGVSDAEYARQIETIEEMEAEGADPFGSAGERGRWYVARLVRCPWCLSIYLGLAVAAAAAWADLLSWGWAVPTALALSAVAGLVSKHLDQ